MKLGAPGLGLSPLGISFFVTICPQSPVPHPCEFFLSQGWETSNLNRKSVHLFRVAP